MSLVPCGHGLMPLPALRGGDHRLMASSRRIPCADKRACGLCAWHVGPVAHLDAILRRS